MLDKNLLMGGVYLNSIIQPHQLKRIGQLTFMWLLSKFGHSPLKVVFHFPVRCGIFEQYASFWLGTNQSCDPVDLFQKKTSEYFASASVGSAKITTQTNNAKLFMTNSKQTSAKIGCFGDGVVCVLRKCWKNAD